MQTFLVHSREMHFMHKILVVTCARNFYEFSSLNSFSLSFHVLFFWYLRRIKYPYLLRNVERIILSLAGAITPVLSKDFFWSLQFFLSSFDNLAFMTRNIFRPCQFKILYFVDIQITCKSRDYDFNNVLINRRSRWVDNKLLACPIFQWFKLSEI